jgi:outer membrane protein TolC
MNTLRITLISVLALLEAFFLLSPVRAEEVLDPRRLREEVLTSNLDSAASRLGIREAEGRFETARASGRPTISLESGISYLANPSDAVILEQGSFGSLPTGTVPPYMPLPTENVTIVDAQEPFYYSASISLTQPIFTWGKVPALVDLREKEMTLARTEAQRTEAQVLVRMYRYLYDLLYQREALAVVKDQEELSKRMLVSIEASMKAGVATELDYEEAKIEMEQIRRSIEALENAVSNLERSILALTGRTDFEGVSIRTDSLVPEPRLPQRDRETWKRLAREENLDLRTADGGTDLAEAAAVLAERQSAGRPDIGLSVKAGWSGSRLPGQEEWDDKGDWFLTVGIAAKGTLLDFGASEGSRKEKASAAEAVRMKYNRAVTDVDIAAERLYDILITLGEDIDYLERRVDLRSRRVTEKEAAEAAGAGSELSVLEAQNEHLIAVLDLTSARMQYSDTCISLLSLAMPSALLSGAPFLRITDGGN